MNRRLTVAAVLAAVFVLLLCIAPSAFAWGNGEDGPDSFGTHDWALQEGNRLAAEKGAGWVNLSAALSHTDDPDSEFSDFYYHVYDVWGSSYGNAPKKISLYYGKALAARKSANVKAASKWVGIMAHYYADICCPLHTDQVDAEDAIHSEYEGDVDEITCVVGQNRDWVSYDGFTATKSVSGYAKSTATASHKQYQELVGDYVAGGMSAAVMTSTARSLNRAANGLADLIVSLKKGIKGGASGSGGGGGGDSGGGGSDNGGGGGGGGSAGSTVVYITDSGEKYHRDGCRYLAKSKIKTTLAKAKAAGCEPCSVCDPPR